MSDLRQELKTDVHLVDIAVLCDRFNTDLVTGKSKSGPIFIHKCTLGTFLNDVTQAGEVRL